MLLIVCRLDIKISLLRVVALIFENSELVNSQGPHSHILMTEGSEGFFWV